MADDDATAEAVLVVRHVQLDDGLVAWRREPIGEGHARVWRTRAVLLQGRDSNERTRLRVGDRLDVAGFVGGHARQITGAEVAPTEQFGLGVRLTFLVPDDQAAAVARAFWPDLPHEDAPTT